MFVFKYLLFVSLTVTLPIDWLDSSGHEPYWLEEQAQVGLNIKLFFLI